MHNRTRFTFKGTSNDWMLAEYADNKIQKISRKFGLENIDADVLLSKESMRSIVRCQIRGRVATTLTCSSYDMQQSMEELLAKLEHVIGRKRDKLKRKHEYRKKPTFQEEELLH